MNMQFWFQPQMPQQKVNQFPWLDDEQVKRLKQVVTQMWVTDIYEKQRKEQELYRKVIQAKQQKDTFDKRNATNNSLYYDTIKQPDPVKRNVWQAQVRMEDLADIVKQKYNLQANAPTNEVLQWFSKMLADQQVDPKLVEDYLNWRSEELLYVSGLKERPVMQQEQQSSDLQTFLTPMVSFLQWASDVWQTLVWKPIDFLLKNTLKLFWVSDEELAQVEARFWKSTEWDITPYLWQSWQTWWAKLIREWWKIAWTAALTAWLPLWWWIWIWAKVSWKELIKNVALRTLVEWWRWLAETATYNMASTWKAWDPINLWLWAWIAAAIWWPLSLLGSRVIAPWVSKLANKLQLSWLLNRTRLDRLQTILKQWWSEDLAKWNAEDVANWMFQREIKWTKQQIINKLDDIANWSMELLDDALVNSTTKHNPEWLVDMLNVLKSEYEWWISATVKKKAWNIDILLNKLDTEWWLTLKEINEVKKMINKDLAPYTASGKVKLSKEDIAAANRQLKTYIEWAVEKEWLSAIWVRMLNNEYAMANSMKQAISEKLNTDMIWEILSFVSNRWWTSVWWALLWSQVWPFNNDSIEWKLGNIVFGFAVGRFLWSTQAKTFTAWLLKKLNSTQKAEILNYINKPKSVKLSDKTSKILLNELNKIDDSINLPNNIYDDVNNINVWPSVKSQSESIPQLKATVKWDSFRKAESTAWTKALETEARKYKSADEMGKQRQLDFIQKNNPMTDDIHVWIRKLDDIKTFQETLNDPESLVYPDFTRKMAEKSIQEWKITIYSSKPLDKNTAQFVTPSKMHAQDYAGNQKIYSKQVDLDDVAWINSDEGQLVWKPKNILAPKSNISKDLQPLYAEARKYKSAEEFIESKIDDYVNSTKNKSQLKQIREEANK